MSAAKRPGYAKSYLTEPDPVTDEEILRMSKEPTASVLELLGQLQDRHAGTPYEVLVDDLVAALAADTTVADLRQELAFRDAEIERYELARREDAARIEALLAARETDRQERELIDRARQSWSRRARALEVETRQGPEDLVRLCARAEREPLDVDISDYSDEWCGGFLAGQVNALEVLVRKGYE